MNEQASGEPAGDVSGAKSSRDSRVRLGAAGVLMACVLTRCVVSLDPFPAWAGDPTLLATPITSLGPTAQIALDAISMLAAGVVLWLSAGVGLWSALLVGAGAIGAAAHATLIDHGSIDNLRVGVSWSAAMVGGLAGVAMARDRACRSLAWGAAMGVVAMLACKGALQYFVEHPDTVRSYKQHRAQFLASQGWSEDSTMARAFERRLFQNEATGWFGLSNVFACVCAGAAIAMLALAGASRRVRDEVRDGVPGWVRASLIIGTLMAGGATALSMSKGGLASALVGVVLLIAGAIVRHRLHRSADEAARAKAVRLGSVLGLLVVAGVLSAVVARGLIGERLGELSIYFRWFYMEGAARIIAEHPLIGVGPADFKDAYLLAKPAISPEEVTSPHSVLLDWVSTLGLAGVAWAIAWLGWVAAAGRTLLRRDSVPTGASSGVWQASRLARVMVILVLVTTAISAFLEASASTTETSISRLIGAALAIWIATGVGMLVDRWNATPAALAAGALALAAHTQIEVAAIWPGSGAWLLLVCSLCAGAANETADGAGSRVHNASGAGAEQTRSRVGRLGARSGAIIAGVLGVASLAGAAGTWAWESKLLDAARLVWPVAETRSRLIALVQSVDGPSGESSTGEVAAMLGELGVKATLDDLEGVQKELAAIQFDRSGRAAEILKDAGERARHAQTLQAASRLWLQRMAARHEEGQMIEAGDEAAKAIDAAEREAEVSPTTPSWNWLGTARREVGTALGRRESLVAAAKAFEEGARLDPHGTTSALELVRVLETLGENTRASEWAGRVLENDRNMRLDPLRRLDEQERTHLERLARGAGGP